LSAPPQGGGGQFRRKSQTSNPLYKKGVRRSASCSKGFSRLTRKSLRQALRTREGSDLTREGRFSVPHG